jgi:hypothetical protein
VLPGGCLSAASLHLIASSASLSSKVALCLMRRLFAMALSSQPMVERGHNLKMALVFCLFDTRLNSPGA